MIDRNVKPVVVGLALMLGACVGADSDTPESTAPGSANTPPTSISEQTTTAQAISPTTGLPPHHGFLLVVGDWGSGTLPQGAVAGAMARFAESHDLAAILTTGDNFYGDDLDFLMAPYDWVAESGIEFWITWGNHDIESDDRAEEIETRFDAPRWAVHEWGAVDIIILDSNQVDSEQQREFLIDELARSDRPVIVAFHHPAFSCSLHGDTPEVIDTWLRLFDDDVVLVLNGHDHNYQRLESDGVSYVVTGGGGRHLYDLEDCPTGHPERIIGSAIHHFLAMDQTEDSLAIEVIDVMGATVDSFEIELS